MAPVTQRRCSVSGCANQPEASHPLPTSHRLTEEWLKFIFSDKVPENISKTLHVCSNHFHPDCFVDAGRCSAGCESKLILREGSAPTLRHSTDSQSDITSHDCDVTQVAYQPEPREKPAVATQLSLSTLGPLYRSTDIRQMSVQQEWSPSLDQLEPKIPHIKEERGELWISQGGEQLHGLEEADNTKFSFTPVPLKSENNEDKAKSSQLHSSQTEENVDAEPRSISLTKRVKMEADGEDRGGSESVRNFDPGRLLQQSQGDEASGSAELKTEVSEDDWMETRKPQSGVNDMGWTTGRTVFSADIQQQLVQQEWSPSLDQLEPEPPHIKQEQEELWTSQEGEQLHGLEEEDDTKLSIIFVHVKSENDEEQTETESDGEEWGAQESARNFDPGSLEPEPPHVKREQEELWTSQEGEQFQGLEETDNTKAKTEAGGEDCGGLESARNLDPSSLLQPVSDGEASDSAEPETEVSEDDWMETGEPQSGLNTPEVHVSDQGCNTGKKFISCSECGATFQYKRHLTTHMRLHTGEKPYSCSICGKTFKRCGHLKVHMRLHTGEKPFCCSICGKNFRQSAQLKVHTRIHNGEKPFNCSICGKSFTLNGNLKVHTRIHTGERPFTCSICGKNFNQSTYLKVHVRIHEGDKPYGCSVCGKKFNQSQYLKLHMRIHKGEQPHSCSVCGKNFTLSENLRAHMRVHTGEKPFPCSICGKNFKWRAHVKSHMRIHTREAV